MDEARIRSIANTYLAVKPTRNFAQLPRTVRKFNDQYLLVYNTTAVSDRSNRFNRAVIN